MDAASITPAAISTVHVKEVISLHFTNFKNVYIVHVLVMKMFVTVFFNCLMLLRFQLAKLPIELTDFPLQ